MTILFEAAAGTTPLKIALHSAAGGTPYTHLAITAGTDQRLFALAAQITGDVLGQGAEAAIAAADLPEAELAKIGFLGFRPAGGDTTLHAMRIVVRPAQPGGAHSSEAPFFALYLDWTIKAEADTESDFAPGSTVVAGATVELVITTGFACIHPPDRMPEVAARALQVRIDLDMLAATTGWLPLPVIDLASPFTLDGLLGWLGALAGLAILPPLPDWDLDLRLRIALPLGLRFRQSYLLLTPSAAGHLIEARAHGLVLGWKGDEFAYDNAAFSLVYDKGAYRFRAVLLAAQAPPKDTPYPGDPARPPQRIALPFGALDVAAAAWRVSVGLFASGSPVKVCPELVIELADVTLRSALADAPLWQANAVRLHLRGARLLACAQSTPLFEGLELDNWLTHYRAEHSPAVPALSGVAKEAASPPPGLEPFVFLDGDFDREGHLALLWEQDGAAMFRALTSVIPGLSEDPDPTQGERHLVAFELARFDTPGGRDHQARVEWRAKDAVLPVPTPSGPPQDLPAERCSTAVGGVHRLVAPPGAVPLEITDAALRLDLPLVTLTAARPEARALLYYRPAGEKATLALLHLHAAARTVLQAKLDLAIAGDGGRELLPTMPSGAAAALAAAGDVAPPPFLDLRLASGAAAQALAVVSWQEGVRPQIMRAFDGRGEPFRPLIPAGALPAPGGDCTRCPEHATLRAAPLRLAPARFRAPDPFAADNGWTLALHIAAERALRSFLAPGGAADSLVTFTISKICFADSAAGGGVLPPLHIHAALAVKFDLLGDGDTVEGAAIFEFDPADMTLRMLEGGTFTLKSQVAPMPAWLRKRDCVEETETLFSHETALFGLGFDALFYKPGAAGASEAEFLTLDLRSGRFVIGLAEGVSCFLRYKDLGDDGLIFNVSEFRLGAAGLDVEATLATGSLKLPGLMAPFTLEAAALSIVGNRVRRMSVGAKGNLPEIMGSAPVAITLTLAQTRAGGGVDLEELSCTLADGKKPIRAGGVRFEFSLTQLALRYVRSGPGKGGRQFFFEVTGAAQFTPEDDEFDGGLLENLKSARCEFTRAPLSDEFIDQLEVIAELNEPVSFDVFHAFRMEIRSIGFAPKHDFEGGAPRAALIIGGQCEFADTGDVISAEIDFHRLYIGMPDKSAMPQVEFKDLRVEIRAADGFRIGGAVRVYDETLRKGFKGDGFVQLPGFPQIGAAFAFMELRRSSDASWKRAWFIALEASGISYQLGALPIYLRQAGLGFGFRMTSLLLRTQPEQQTLQQLVAYLIRALDEHQTLANGDSWTEDLEEAGPGRWSVAAEAVFTLGSSQADPLSYDAKAERKLRTILLQLMLAMNPNGLVAGAKLWFPVSYDDLLNNRHDMRRRPLAKGFVQFAPRAQRLLAYATKSPNPYYGPPDDPLTDLAKTVLDPVPFECAALVEPGRLRGEIGWPDRLVFSFDLGPLKIECRGGILYAVENNTAVYGLYFAARGRLALGGGGGNGSFGLRVSAETTVQFATRLMIAQPLLKPLGGYVYAQVGIDLSVRFSVEAWFKFRAGFVKITLRISFSVSLQILIALEIGLADGRKLGFKGRATVVISIFGRGLRASISAGLNESGVDTARAFVARYMSSMLEPGKIPPVPGDARPPAPIAEIGALAADSLVRRLGTDAGESSLCALAPPDEECFAFATIPLAGTTAAGERHWLLWIMPTTAGDGFYPLPGMAPQTWAKVGVPAGTALFALDAVGGWSAGNGASLDLHVVPDATFPVEGGPEPLTLRRAIAGCYRPLGDAATESFPFDFIGTCANLDRVAADRRAEPGDILVDERVHEGPRDSDPVLNPAHPYDAALAEVIGAASKAGDDRGVAERAEEARANQGFLLTAFRGDIAAYVKAQGAGAPAAPTPAEHASVWDSGTVLLLRAAELPDWAARRDASGGPSFSIDGAPHPPLRPLVTLADVSFAGDALCLVHPPVAHFDDQRLALSWMIDWTDGKAPDTAPGIGQRVEDYLDHYRVELFARGGGRKPLVVREVLPANLLGAVPMDSAAGGRKELAPAYSFSIPTEELFGSAANGGQTVREVIAVITPVDQYDSDGRSFTISAAQEPSYTPLPAEEPRLELGWAKDKLTAAEISWREPALPDQDSIASTTHWDLVVRKVPRIALGAYPFAAEAPGEAGGLAGAEQDLRPGDLVARIPKDDFSILEPLGEGPFGSRSYKLRIEAARLPKSIWFDHLGNAVPVSPTPPTAALAVLRDAFLGKVSALEAGGHAWQLFLRAAAKGGGNRFTCSSLAPVRAYATIPGAPGTPPRQLPLAVLEWPKRVEETWLDPPEVVHGPRHVPTIPVSWDGIGSAPLDYLPAGTGERVVSLRWSSYAPARADAPRPALAAYAGFRLFEAREEGLTDADLAARAKLTPDRYGCEIASFEAADPAVAAAAPASLLQTELWQSWSPAEARLLAWRDTAKPERWPRAAGAANGWYSWADADLIWPPAVPPATPPDAEPAPGSGPGAAGEHPAFVRANLHPMLAALVTELEGWALVAGAMLEITAGRPDPDAASRFDWMVRADPVKDPYGWAALWHLGLALEIAARDPSTGAPVAQDMLYTACRDSVAKLLDDARFAALAPHLALDLPLKANDGLAAAKTGPALADAALGRLQIALRPRVAPSDLYYWIAAAAGDAEPGLAPAPWTAPKDGAAPPQGVHWMTLGTGDDTAGFVAYERDPDVAPEPGAPTPFRFSPPLAELWTPGRQLLFKVPAYLKDAFDAEIARHDGQIAAFSCVPRPLCFDDGAGDLAPAGATGVAAKAVAMPLWPHGRFAAATGAPHREPFDRFVQLLEAAPLAPQDDARDEEGSSLKPRPILDDERAKIADAYCAWSHRFFAAAPLGDAAGPLPFGGHNSAPAALRSEAVDILAPAADGSYRHNRLVSWQWATARSLGVAGVGRYDRLLSTLSGGDVRALRALRAPAAPGARRLARPFALDRIRKLEPPQLIGDCIVADQAGDAYHEIAIALHEEEKLAGQNSLAAFKLQFRGLGFRFHRRLRFADWADKLAAAAPDHPPSALYPPPVWSEMPRFAASDDSFLSRYPSARFGATSLHLPAEPFYYESHLDLKAAAATIESATLPYALALPAPAPCTPAAGDTLRVTPAEVAFEGALGELAADWRSALGADSDSLAGLGMTALAIDLRFPRLFESLTGTQRSFEDQGAGYGRMPDPEARIQLVAEQGDGAAPLCIVEGLDNPAASDLFALQPLAEGLRFEMTAHTATWETGVHLDLRAILQLAPLTADATMTLPLAQTPVTEADRAQLFAPDRLPAWGSLAALAPLALRLSFASSAAGSRLVFDHVFDPGSALARPLTASAAGTRPGADDLAVALRLLLDPERLVAAKAVACDGGEAPPALRAAIETASAAVCRTPGAGELTPAAWQRWTAGGLNLWLCAAPGAPWQKGDMFPDTPPWRLLACRAAATPASTALAEVLALTPLPGAAPQPVAMIAEAERLAAALARPWFESAARAWNALPRPGAVAAFVQRGNDPQTRWSPKP